MTGKQTDFFRKMGLRTCSVCGDKLNGQGVCVSSPLHLQNIPAPIILEQPTPQPEVEVPLEMPVTVDEIPPLESLSGRFADPIIPKQRGRKPKA